LNVDRNTTKMRRLITILFLIFIFNFGNSQETKISIKINTTGEYIHKATKSKFPEKLENLNRVEVLSLDNKEKNIVVSYASENNKTNISINIYPSESAYEGRLREEYLNSIKSLLNKTQLEQKYIKYQGDKFICNGFKGMVLGENNSFTEILIFECGTWFLKLQLETNELDKTQIDELLSKIIKFIDPSKLTGVKKLNKEADLTFDQNKIKDDITLEYSMGSAFKKLEWVKNNIPENECASGFPDLYLDMHIVSLTEVVNILEKNKSTGQYLKELNLIINSGFLNEFILDQYQMVMIIPENIKLDFERYKLWKEKNNTEINLNDKKYNITYN